MVMTSRQTVLQISREMELWVRLPDSMTWDWAQGLEAEQVNENEWLLDDLVGAWRMVRMEDELAITPVEPQRKTTTKKLVKIALDVVLTIGVVGGLAIVASGLGKLIFFAMRWALGGGR
jgi:hypothetical protein